jgi:hypothetical protein
LFCIAGNTFSQVDEDAARINHFMAMASITNNGISMIPTFSLGKPAAIFEMSLGRRLSFDPQFRFSLEGKPWSFVFWWRYEVVNSPKFRMKIGAHPAFAFKDMTIDTDQGSNNVIRVQRFLAGEIAPNIFIAKNTSIGMYYLFAHGVEKDATQYTHYITANANFSRIAVSRQFYLRFNPQFYYLKMDKADGFYFSSGLTLARDNFPLTISSLINKVIQTEISASRDFSWNVSLVYTFSKKFSVAK